MLRELEDINEVLGGVVSETSINDTRRTELVGVIEKIDVLMEYFIDDGR